MKSRNDKLSFLKGLALGSRSIHELANETFEVFEQLGPDAFKRLSIGNTDSVTYSKINIEQFKKGHPKALITVFVNSQDNVPLLKDSDIIWHEEKSYLLINDQQ